MDVINSFIKSKEESKTEHCAQQEECERALVISFNDTKTDEFYFLMGFSHGIH